MTKQCSRCKNILDVSNFYRSTQNKSGFYSRCKKCASDNYKEYAYNNSEKIRNSQVARRKANPDKERNSAYKYRFGITLDQFNEMARMQNGVCKICELPNTKNIRLVVDHCHSTGKVRSLLCTRCNTAIGLLKEDLNILKKAYTYLESYKNAL